jgi:hypothetical protein
MNCELNYTDNDNELAAPQEVAPLSKSVLRCEQRCCRWAGSTQFTMNQLPKPSERGRETSANSKRETIEWQTRRTASAAAWMLTVSRRSNLVIFLKCSCIGLASLREEIMKKKMIEGISE